MKFDCRSTTGNNLRNILLLSKKSKVDFLVPSDANFIKYQPIDETNLWRIGQIEELVDSIHKNEGILGFERAELKEILDHICTT